MFGFCALVLGHICVPSQYAPVTTMNQTMVTLLRHGHPYNLNALAHTARIQTGAAVEIFTTDFSIGGVPAPKLGRACAGNVCVYYRRHCTDELHCEYYWTDMPRSQSHGLRGVDMGYKLFTLSARTLEDMRDLQRNVTFVLAADKAPNVPVGRLSAADLRDESPDMNFGNLDDCRGLARLRGQCPPAPIDTRE